MAAVSRYEQLTDNCLLEFQRDDTYVNDGSTGTVSEKIIKWKTFQNEHEILVVPYVDDLESTFKKSLPGFHVNTLLTKKDDTVYEERYFSFGSFNTLTNDDTINRIPKNKYIQNTFTSKCKLVNNRFHFRSGYTVPKEGLFIKYYVGKIVFFNAFITQENFKRLVRFNERPLVVGTKVYDRYIDIRTLDLGSLYSTNDELSAFLAIGNNPIFNIEVSDAEEYYTTETQMYEFELRNYKSRHSIPYNSIFDKFNVVIFENKSDNYIEYYPVWGDFENIKKSISGKAVLEERLPDVLSTDIIARLSNGEISAFYGPDYHEKDPDFDDQYQGMLRWCTVHELILTEVIEPIDSNTLTLNTDKIFNTRKTEFIETYDNKTTGYNFKYKFRPIIENPGPGQIITRLLITYNCKLWNKQDNTQIVRSTSLVINNPVERYGSKSFKLEPLSLNKFIIFNKKEDKDGQIVVKDNREPVIKYEKIFVDSQNIQCNINGIENEQGILTSKNIFAAGPNLNLYQTSHFYKFRFVNNYSNKTGEYGLKALDLSGPYKYVLRVYDNINSPLDINVDYSTENVNPVLGELQFCITEDIINRIKKSDKPQWSILCITDSGIESTLATGAILYR